MTGAPSKMYELYCAWLLLLDGLQHTELTQDVAEEFGYLLLAQVQYAIC